MLAIWIFLCSFSLFYSYFKFTALSVLRAALRWFLSSSEAIPTLSSIISQPPPSHSHSFALFLGPLRPCLSLAPVKSSHYSWMRGCLSWHSSAPTCTGSLTQRPWQLSALSPLTPTPPPTGLLCIGPRVNQLFVSASDNIKHDRNKTPVFTCCLRIGANQPPKWPSHSPAHSLSSLINSSWSVVQAKHLSFTLWMLLT